MKKKTIFIDMDGVIVNLQKAIADVFNDRPELKGIYGDCPDEIEGIFLNAPIMEGARESITKLQESGKYDLFIATSAPWENPTSSASKRIWVERYFGDLFYKKMFVTHRKDLLIGDYLIDDRTKNGAAEFQGEHLQFGVNYETGKVGRFPDWNSILNYLL
jgi:5'-nucleotidase